MLNFNNINKIQHFVLIILFITTNYCFSATWYLDPSKSDGGDGQTENTAFNSISAMESASMVGDTVYIRNMDFYIDNEPVIAANYQRDITKYDWPDRIYYSNKISQFGITWTFDTDYRIGQFANHDMWVLGPVSINTIFPESTEIDGRIKNGAVINPDPTEYRQGYDNRTRNVTYIDELNIAMNCPVTIDAGSSVISSITNDIEYTTPQLETAAILTVIDTPVADNSFRPAYCGQDKTITYNISDLEYDLLASLQPVASVPRLEQRYGDSQTESVERMFERPWLDYVPGNIVSEIHPSKNMPWYGRNIAEQVSLASLMLHLNYSAEEKRNLLIRFVQLGIDNYGIIINGGKANWRNSGGHSSGRKWPILFAGLMLGDAGMQSIGQKSGDYLYQNGHDNTNPPPDYIQFSEDDQTFYVSKDDIIPVPYEKIIFKNGFVFYGKGNPVKRIDYSEYTINHLGMPEWGIDHVGENLWDGLSWGASYRQCCNAVAWTGYILAAHIMDAKDLWNKKALFDYQDRYMQVTRSDGLYPGFRVFDYKFLADMWDTYRADYGPVWSGSYDIVAPNAPLNLVSVKQTSNTIKLKWDIPSIAIDGDTAIAYRIFRNDKMLEESYPFQEYTDNDDLVAETEYSYRICSIDDFGIQSVEAALLTVSTMQNSSDITPPEKVTGLYIQSISQKIVNLVWTPAIDHESMIHHYNIFRDGEYYGQTTKTSFSDICNPSTEYEYAITAINIGGLESEKSNSVKITSQSNNLVMNISFDNSIQDLSVYSLETSCDNTVEYSIGRFGNALVQTGNSSVIASNTADVFTEMEEVTISIWGKMNSYSACDLINGLVKIKFTSSNLYAPSININSDIYKNTDWHHYCYTHDGKMAKMYLDGIMLTSGEITGNISGGYISTSSNYNGLIDEFRVYRRALSEEEIQDIYLNNGYPEAPVADVHDPTFEFYSDNYANALSAAPAETSVTSSFHSTEPGPGLILYSKSQMLVNDFADELQAELINRRDNDLQMFDRDNSDYDNAQFDVNLIKTLLNAPKYDGVSYELTTRNSVGTGHTATLSNLSDGTEYFYALVVSDRYGNVGAIDSEPTKSASKFKFTTAVIINPNAAPVGGDDTLTASEDVAKVSGDLTANDSDADNDTLTISGVSGCTKGGTVTINSDKKSLTYTTAKDYDGTNGGPDSFTYTVSDGHGGTDTATVTVNITPVNDDPVATDSTLTLDEDSTAVSGDLTANGSDVDGDGLAVSGVTNASHGTVNSNGDGTVTYKPSADYYGSDKFTYTLSDGNGGTATGTVNVTVRPVNDGPVAVNDSITLSEDTDKTVSLVTNDTDVDNDTLSISSVTQGENGSVINNGNGTVTYSPLPNFIGNDSFTYTVSDGNGKTASATVNVVVTQVNDEPVAVSDSIVTNEDTAKTSGNLLANDTDGDNDTLTITSVTQGGHGSVVNNGNGTVTYTPAANYHGDDSFTYTISDSKGGTDTATVAVTVTSVNDKPVAGNDTIAVNEDIAKVSGNLLANDSDVDGDTISVSAVSQGAHGTVINVGNGTVTYTPAANYNGSDSFTYTVSDGKGGTATGTVNVLIAAVNDKPEPTADILNVTEDTDATSGNLLTNDTDAEGDTLTITSVSQGSHGRVSNNNDGTVTYRPASNYNGLDTFTYTVSDNHGGTAIGTVNVVVAAVPDEPVITASSTLSVAALGTLNFQVSANDLDGDTVSFSFEGVPDGADFVDNGGGKATFNWVPAKDQAGSYNVKVIAKDDSEAALSVAKTIVISVSDADNNIPVFAEIGDKNATEMSQLSFTISATDADGDSLAYSKISLPTNASFNANTRTFTWTPDYDQGRDEPYTAEFKVDDSFNGVATATVKIYVADKNRKPEFTSFSVPGFVEDTENIFTISATDPDGDSITYSGVNLPVGAILNENSGVFSWKPGYEDAGNKSVTFRATDSNNEYTDKTVSLTVANTNRDPEFTDSTYSSYSATAENKLKFTVYTSDPDGDAVTVKWNGKPSGAAFDTNTNAFAWIPKAGTQGSYEAVFTAKDSNGATVSKTITIAVDLGNQPPVFNQVTVPEFTETDTVKVTVAATDPDGDSLVYSMSGHPADATIDRNSGQIRWQTGYDDAGVYTIVVKASDGEHEVDKEISVTVNNLNRKPAVTVSGNTSPAYVDGLKLTVSTSDEDGDAVTVSVSNLPGGAAFDKNAGIISWAPKQTDIGQYNIVVTANDGVDDTIKTVAVTINQDPDYVPNKPPVFVNVSKKQVNEGDQITFAVEASDPEGDKVQISASNLPSGAVFANNTFSWQTTSEDAGEYSVIFIATDGKSSASMTVLLAVENVNAAPTGLVEGPTKIVAGQLLSLTVSATDPDGDAISYALDKAPKTMGIDGNVISWQTNAKDGGNIYKFSVIVSDDKGASVSIPVVLTVSEAALDSEPPQMVSTYPKKGSVQIPLNPLITFTLSDIDAGVDYESISITVDGTEVFAGSSMSSVSEDAENVMYSSQDSQVVRTGNPTRYTFQYQAVDMFDYDYTPEVVIRAADMQGNEMEPYRFTFTTEMFSMTAPIPVEDSDSKSGSDAFSQSEPEVSVSANGTVWSVWTEGKAGNKTIKFAPYYDNTGQFDSARSISGDGEMAEPDLATAANGDLYMVWQNNVAGNWDICVGRSSNGMSMDMTATVSTSQEEQTNPAIAVAANGDIYVAYETKRKTGKDIFVAKVSSDLVSVIETVVCSNNAEQVNPVIVSGADGDIHIAWEDFRDGSCSVYAASMKNGWQNYKLASNASEPDIIVDTSCDYLHTVWNSNDDIYYSKIPLPLDGRTVNAANVIDDSTGSVQSSPSVYHFNNGKVNRTLVAWTDTRNAISNNDNDIYFASVDRGSMTNVLATIDTELNSQSAPAIATNASGAPYIVFQEQDGKNQSIQMACASVIERMLGKNLIRANEGGYVGVRIEDIDSVDDVTVIVPADAISGDVEMSIARVSNPPGGAGIRSLFSYDFGPSSTREFRKAVNIVIPYPATVGGANVSVFWYNPQTGTYSQSGMSEIEVIDINSELKAISFKTTHFSQYSVSAEFVPWMVSSGEADD